MSNRIVCILDRTTYCMYLVAEVNKSQDRNMIEYRAFRDRQKKAQMWFIEHATTARGGLYAHEVATVLSNSGKCPVPNHYGNDDDWHLIGSMAYAESGGMMPTPAMRKEMREAYDKALKIATEVEIDFDMYDDMTNVPEEDGYVEAQWYTDLSAALNIYI